MIAAETGLNWSPGWTARWLEALPSRVDHCPRTARTSASSAAEADTDDAAWISRVRAGDEMAARALVERLVPIILKIVRGRLPRRTLEEDLVQTVFAKIFRSLHQFSGLVPLEHWVSRIAINTCINQIKHERGRPELRMSDLSEEQEAVVQHLARTTEELPIERAHAARELLQQLLQPLLPADRLVIHLLHLEERSVEEVAAITGWSPSLVKVKAFRARHKMRRVWTRLLKSGRWN